MCQTASGLWESQVLSSMSKQKRMLIRLIAGVVFIAAAYALAALSARSAAVTAVLLTVGVALLIFAVKGLAKPE